MHKNIQPSKKNILHKLDMLQAQINSEKEKYKKAIENNQKFEDVKVIYLKIKELEKEATTLMQHANKLHNI
jgi:hypothetical protein